MIVRDSHVIVIHNFFIDKQGKEAGIPVYQKRGWYTVIIPLLYTDIKLCFLKKYIHHDVLSVKKCTTPPYIVSQNRHRGKEIHPFNRQVFVFKSMFKMKEKQLTGSRHGEIFNRSI